MSWTQSLNFILHINGERKILDKSLSVRRSMPRNLLLDGSGSRLLAFQVLNPATSLFYFIMLFTHTSLLTRTLHQMQGPA